MVAAGSSVGDSVTGFLAGGREYAEYCSDCANAEDGGSVGPSEIGDSTGGSVCFVDGTDTARVADGSLVGDSLTPASDCCRAGRFDGADVGIDGASTADVA